MWCGSTDSHPGNGVLLDVPIGESQYIGQGLHDLRIFETLGGVNKIATEQARYSDPFVPQSNDASTPREHHECIVCFNAITKENENNKHFTHCRHNNVLCNSCGDRLDECPLCRSIKPGREAAVAAAAEQFATLGISDGTQCGTGAGPAVLTERDAGDQSSVASPESDSSNVNSTNDALDAELDTMWGNNIQLQNRSRDAVGQSDSTDFMTLFENAQWNKDVMDVAEPQRVPSLGAQIRELDRLMASEAAVVASNTSVPLPPLTPMPQLRNVSDPSFMLVDRDEPSLDVTSRAAAYNDQGTEPKDSHGKDHISRRENPFAKHSITDVEVSDCTFNEFAQLMRRLNFSEAEQQEGKKFRKRLKNRKQVMSYSARKRNVSKSMGARIAQLETEIKRFRTANNLLEAKNAMLSKKIEEHAEARAMAELEAQNLRMQVQALKALLAQRTQ
eukprot:m.252097 g.252097  ORF g.252097 m.252097 type:complete len:446 (-) comp19552_c0_seq1:918-2255(-)